MKVFILACVIALAIVGLAAHPPQARLGVEWAKPELWQVWLPAWLLGVSTPLVLGGLWWVSKNLLQGGSKRGIEGEIKAGDGDLKKFLMGNGLPGYIGALSAVTAVAVGVFAYSSWRSQETAKRRADVAMDLLRQVNDTEVCIRASLGPVVWSDFGLEGAERLREPSYESLQSLAKSVEQKQTVARGCGEGGGKLLFLASIANLILDKKTGGLAHQLGERSRIIDYEYAQLMKCLPKDRKESICNRLKIEQLLQRLGAETWVTHRHLGNLETYPERVFSGEDLGVGIEGMVEELHLNLEKYIIDYLIIVGYSFILWNCNWVGSWH